MYIQYIAINNFRGLAIELKGLEKDFLIIGKNDTGKTNICYAIRKVLDPKVRNIPLIKTDSTGNKNSNILIKIELCINDSTKGKNKRKKNEKMRQLCAPDSNIIKIKFEAKYNKGFDRYDESIFINEKKAKYEDIKLLDSGLKIIYIDPTYDFEKEKSNYLLLQDEKTGNNNKFSKNLKKINNQIMKVPEIEQISNSITAITGEFKRIFENIDFKTESKIDASQLFQNLDITPSIKSINVKIGDGKSKIISMLLKKSIFNSKTEQILIVEEPENHLYPLLQKDYVSLLKAFNPSQLICTTHSPYIIDFEKNKQIVKLNKLKGKNITSVNKELNKNFGYLLNEEIAEIFFYDNVLLVEGYSEKYFYNNLYVNDESFQKQINEKNMGIFCVYGIDFGPSMQVLKKLGINVMIKTDNDIYKIQNKSEYRYAGLERTVNCLDSKSQKDICKILSIKVLDNDTFRFKKNDEKHRLLQNNMGKITKIFEENNIYVSEHSEGFEKDFLEFVDSKNYKADYNFLSKAKLKNLHSYIVDKNITLSITDKNKDSILLKFLKQE